MIKLVKLIGDIECPDDSVNKVISWAYQVYKDGSNFPPHASTHKSNNVWMRKIIVNNDNLYPNAFTF